MSSRTTLTRIVYRSLARINMAAQEGSAQLLNIVRTSQKRNEFSVITSVLLFDRTFFVQVLEGDKPAVHETFQRVLADERHKDIEIVEWRDINRRDFVSSLALFARGPENEAQFAKFGFSEMLHRKRIKASAIQGLALALQAQTLSRRGIELYT
jgi:hypothetical protein